MATTLIGGLIFAWGMGIGALVHQEDLMKIHVVKKASELK